jgi:CHAT domain-containing protein
MIVLCNLTMFINAVFRSIDGADMRSVMGLAGSYLERAGRWRIALALIVSGFLLFEGLPGEGQTAELRAPTLTYFATFADFYAGNYKTALDRFQAEARGCIKSGQMRWIDSICYEAMIGECYYQMGMLDKALEHYNSALEICATFSNWMVSVRFDPIRASNQRKPAPWGTSTRQSVLGYYPESSLISQGRIDNTDIYRSGGVVQNAVLYSIQPQEIVRCTTLAIRRRTELLGPISKNTPLTEKLVGALNARIAPPNNWSEAWADLERGLALISAGKEDQAIPCLQRSVLAAGEFDHPMTCVALLELGRLALMRGDYQQASQFFEESTFSAWDYGDQGVLEEAFRYAAITHLAANRKGFYTPLQAAWQWAKVKDLRQLRVSLALSAAENYLALNDTRDATVMLDDARLTLGKRKSPPGRAGGRFSYLGAQLLFQQHKVQEGQAAFGSAMTYMQQGSNRLFQIALADNFYASGATAPRTAMEYYNELLRDPQARDWTLDPMETLAVLVTPHGLAMEHWFEAACERREHELAWEIADRARRHRFFSTLEMGGRLQSLRWILEPPAELLDEQAMLQRRDLLLRWPQYAKLADEARAIRTKLADLPLASEDQTAWKEQSRLLAELASLSAQQEAILREIALRREPAAMIFPPLRTVADVRKLLPKGHAILAFFVANHRLYGLLMNNADYSQWEIASLPAFTKQMSALLREMGQYQPNHELTPKDITDTKWTLSAAKLLDVLLKGSRADFSKSFEELAIVPDGMLWYLPFDALQVGVDGQLQPLISRVRIRYCPTLSLAVAPQARQSKPNAKTAVILGKLYPRDDDARAKAAFERLSAVLPGAVALKPPSPGPNADYKVCFNRLIVLDDLSINDHDPYGWTPAPIDRTKSGSASLAEWMSLPWGGPEEIILPGYHTSAEDALKRSTRTAPGEELFLSVCGLMSCGARTILLGRWRTGGQSSFDLVREFAQELPHTSPADAWQRAVILETSSPVNLEAEPRIKRLATDEIPKADHPFFWAGYMLVDSGQSPAKTEPKSAAPETKPATPDPKPAEPDAKPAALDAQPGRPDLRPAGRDPKAQQIAAPGAKL